MATLPAQFSALEAYVSAWALPTTTARLNKRIRTPYPEIEAFYKAMAEHMEAIMQYLDGFPPKETDLAPDTLTLLHLAKAFTEAAMSVELLKAPDEPMVIPVDRLTLWP